MKNLTEIQIQFIVQTFFRNEEFAGWKNIATKLVTTGRCMVAGTDSIWRGGIGNFIAVTEAEDAVGCSLYLFDFNEFIKSEYFKDTIRLHYKEAMLVLQDAINKFKDLYSLLKEAELSQ